MDARFVEGFFVMPDTVVGMIQGGFQALELKRADLITRRDLDRLEGVPTWRKIDALKLQTRHAPPPTCLYQIFRCAAFQCFSRLAISAGLKWQ